jgi:hypothetical protein
VADVAGDLSDLSGDEPPGTLGVVDAILVEQRDLATILVGFRAINDDRIVLVVRADRWGSATRHLLAWQSNATPVMVRGPSPTGEISLEASGDRRSLNVHHVAVAQR